MKGCCQGYKWSEDEVQIEITGKCETARCRKIQVGSCPLRTASSQEPTKPIKAHGERGYYGFYERQYDHE